MTFNIKAYLTPLVQGLNRSFCHQDLLALESKDESKNWMTNAISLLFIY